MPKLIWQTLHMQTNLHCTGLFLSSPEKAFLAEPSRTGKANGRDTLSASFYWALSQPPDYKHILSLSRDSPVHLIFLWVFLSLLLLRGSKKGYLFSEGFFFFLSIILLAPGDAVTQPMPTSPAWTCHLWNLWNNNLYSWSYEIPMIHKTVIKWLHTRFGNGALKEYS